MWQQARKINAESVFRMEVAFAYKKQKHASRQFIAAWDACLLLPDFVYFSSASLRYFFASCT